MSRLPFPKFEPTKFEPSAGKAPPPGSPAASNPPSAAPAPPADSATAASNPPARAGVLSVSQVAVMVDSALREKLAASLRIIGQVSNFTDRQHWYFAIKDAESVLPCIMFAARTRGVGFVPSNGQEVVITGRVEFYKPQGKVSIYVEKMEPVGAGALEIAFRKLVEEVRALGWFAPERKRPLPQFPRTIALITSRTGAAIADVLDTMRRRCPAVGVVFVDTLVQGAGAAPAVAAALRWVSTNSHRLGIDAVIVTRGGGSAEDLWAFNDKTVAEAIVSCRVPVAAAIGHETDTTIAELVADERCATPTQAAMRLTPDRSALTEQLTLQASRLTALVKRDVADRARHIEACRRQLLSDTRSQLQLRARRLDQAGARLENLRPARLQAARSAALRARAERLIAAMRQSLVHAATRSAAARQQLDSQARLFLQRRALGIESAERQLELVGPRAVLRRGYSVTLDQHGRVVRSTLDVRPGQPITTRLADGQVQSVVDGGAQTAVPLAAPPARPATPDPALNPTPATPPTPPAIQPARRRSSGTNRPDDTPSLFGG